MAERRMFAKTIIDSDAFIDMPVTARLLYYDLAMRADDDGFVNSPKKIMRMIGASQDDLGILIMRKFIIPFESGVVVIKHWRIHNYIRSDRYKPTEYADEKAQLSIKDNGAYTLDTIGIPNDNQLDTNGIPMVDTLDTQDRLGKVRLGKDSLGKDRLDNVQLLSTESPKCPSKSKSIEKEIDTEKEKDTRVDYSAVITLYHQTCPSLPAVRKISDKRKQAIKARLRSYSIDEIKEAFEKAEASDFMKGNNKHNWTADFDWIMNDTNIAKVLDGKYDNKAKPVNQTGTITIPMPDYIRKQVEDMDKDQILKEIEQMKREMR